MNLPRLLQTIQEGRGQTGILKEMPKQGMKPPTFSGINEFLECAKGVPLSRINECIDELTKKPFLPETMKVQVKPDWLWLMIGFAAGWILKR